MPTNILRNRGTSVTRASQRREPPVAGVRRVLIRAGKVQIRAELADTETARRIWSALPIYSTAETWGQSVHFETPVESGRDRTARVLAEPGEIYFWSEEDRVVIVFGPTPISRRAERRLPRPCNVWAKALDDVALLNTVVPGEKVSVTAL